MDSQTREKRQKLISALGKLFGEAGAALQKKNDAASRFAELSNQFENRQRKFKRIDRLASTELLQQISDGAGLVAGVLPRLSRRSSLSARRQHAEQLSSGLNQLSDAFRKAARGMHLVPPSKSKPKTRRRTSKPPRISQKERLNQRIREAHAHTVALAYEYHTAAMAVRDAARLEQPEDRFVFRPPILHDCSGSQAGCNELVFGKPELPPSMKKRSSRKAAPIDEKALLLVAGQLGETSIMTAMNLSLMAELLPVVLLASLIPCTDSCSPLGVVRVRPFMAGPRLVLGKWYPVMGFIWTMCCDCPCWYLLSQQRQVDVWVYNQVLSLNPKDTSSEATREAQRLSRQLADGFTTALNSGEVYSAPNHVNPEFKPPVCIC